MSHLFETIGRQSSAWSKTEQIIQTAGVAFSDECLYSQKCIDEATSSITTLRAEIDKESREIDNLWSESVIGSDFEEYFSNLDERQQTRLYDVINIYFPEEAKDLDTTTGTNLLL